MGKGDQRTKRGKIVRGSYGKTRLRKPDAPVAAAPAKKAKKAAAKKTSKAKAAEESAEE